MKKLNKIGKINALYRIIAGILVFTIALLAYSEMKEVKADDEMPSSIEIDVVDYLRQTVHVYADAEKKATVNFTNAGNYHVVSFGAMADNDYDYVYNSSITFNNIARGANKQYVINFDYTHMGSVPSNEIPITIIVHGREKLVPQIAITPLSSSVVYGTLDDYSEISPQSFVTITQVTDSTATPKYFKDGSDITSQATTRPMKPGTYEVTLNCSDAVEYEAGSASALFTVSKYTPTLTIPDVNPGETPHPTYSVARGGEIVDCSNGMGMEYGANVMYKGENDSDYNEVVPTAAGTYSAKIFYSSELEELNNPATTTFTISLKEGKGKVTVADTVYGESSVKPKAESDTNDADKAEFFYKVKNTEDSTYTKELPKKPGKYVCKAVFPKTGSYDECTATCEFVIEKAKGVGTLTASDVYVGMEPKASPVSATNGVTAVTYQYKEKGAADSNYSDKLPTRPGEYTVKATFATTDYYLETSATANFKTSYMPAPTFGLTGKQGKNDFYTDTVSVKAPAGYEVSLSYGKDYKDSINILDGVKYVYFKDKATGALSDKAAVPSYKMDSVLPVVKGVKNNDTIFKDEYELEVTDDYLEMVKVNDQTIPVKDGKATYKLTSDSGEMLYKIEATDQAGHTVTYTITVASPWVKDGFVPAGQIVKLKPGKAYSLKGGKKYKIKGDDTVYNGGTQFYVDEERELELEEYNEN